MTSKEIKIALMFYWRFSRGYHLTASEVLTLNVSYYQRKKLGVTNKASSFYADVLAINPEKDVLEFEVKTSIADLKNEFRSKELKHTIYQRCSEFPKSQCLIPNKLYYVLPKDLIEQAAKILKDTPYGLAQVNHTDVKKRTPMFTFVKRAKKLHDKAPKDLIKVITKRMSSELIYTLLKL